MSHLNPASTRVTKAFRYLGFASFLTASATARALSLDPRPSAQALGEGFTDFMVKVASQKDSSTRQSLVDGFAKRLKNYGRAIIEDTTVYMVYQGSARHVSVASDLNGWRANVDTMRRLDKTNLFYFPLAMDRAARFEYKFVVDSVWGLDPFNQQHAIGGYGANSEIWMPGYRPPKEIEYRDSIRHGTLDTLAVRSGLLKRTHPVFVYLPPDYRKSRKRYPALYVTDGGEYISLALMVNVLDNLIAEKRIQPIVGIFVDPRTDIRDAQTSKRMFDYTMSDTFVDFLITELRTRMLKRYRLERQPEKTGIMGASLGGLISTYAAYARPDIFGLFAAQSPSYWWKDSALIKLIEHGEKRPIRGYIDTGTIRDAKGPARKMKDVMAAKGYNVAFAEYPEGHNWVNWRAHIDDILECFWGVKTR